jgi:hypothetical protein
MPLRRTPLVSVSALARSPFVAKPAKRSPEENRAKTALRRRSGGRCEGCGRAEATDAAHRLARSQGGLWHVVNLLHLDRPCHRWQHDNPEMARSVGWTVRRGQNPATTPALLHAVGLVLLGADGSLTPIERTTP